jgi:hypothetical protein
MREKERRCQRNIQATHNTLQQKAGHRSGKCPGFSPDELRVAFSIPSGSLFLVNHPVYDCAKEKVKKDTPKRGLINFNERCCKNVQNT